MSERVVAALVLAAGSSRRMSGGDKLLETIGGVPMVARVVDAALGAGAAPVVVVTRPSGGEVREALAHRNVEIVPNPRHALGLSTSLVAGAEALADRARGALVCLADMPLVTQDDLHLLIDAFERSGATRVCVPIHSGRRGNPVLWPLRFLPELRELWGDRGAQDLLARLGDDIVEVLTGPGVLVDVDTREALGLIRELGERC